MNIKLVCMYASIGCFSVFAHAGKQSLILRLRFQEPKEVVNPAPAEKQSQALVEPAESTTAIQQTATITVAQAALSQKSKEEEKRQRQIREIEEESRYIRSHGLGHIETYREALEANDRFLESMNQQ